MLKITVVCLLTLAAACGDKGNDSGNENAHDHSDHDGDTDLPDDFDPATEHTSSTGITVSYTTDPNPIPESLEFSVTFSLSSGTMTEADATMPMHGGHGMPVAPVLNDNGDGTYTATPFEFQMPGYWIIHATVKDDDGNEERVDFEVDCCE